MQKAETTQVIILTKNLRIEGEISLFPGGRLTDYMNESKQFIVVTNATIMEHTGKSLTSGSFLNLNVAKIEIIMLKESEG